MNEIGPNNEALTEQQESQEQLVSQKFDEFYKKIDKLRTKYEGYNGYDGKVAYEDQNGIIIDLGNGHDSDGNYIDIRKGEDNLYELKKCGGNPGTFELRYGKIDGILKSSKNITPESVLSEILPNFDRRLNEAETYINQKKQEELRNASEYAQIQDQEDVEAMMNQALSNPDIRTA